MAVNIATIKFACFIKGQGIDGHRAKRKILHERLKENIFKAQRICENLLSKIIDKKIKVFTIHLKADNINSYTALFAVELNDFVSDKFREVYTLSRQIKNESDTDTFYITFSFIPNSKQLSEDCLEADGFFMKYEKESGKAGSRAA